jgi:hypothetical protein
MQALTTLDYCGLILIAFMIGYLLGWIDRGREERETECKNKNTTGSLKP